MERGKFETHTVTATGETALTRIVLEHLANRWGVPESEILGGLYIGENSGRCADAFSHEIVRSE